MTLQVLARNAVMQKIDRMSIRIVAADEQTAALEDLAEATQGVAMRLSHGEKPTDAELDREEAALLRLQNARALLALGISAQRGVS
jgi:hypothetical protein